MPCLICDGPGSLLASVHVCKHEGLTYKWEERLASAKIGEPLVHSRHVTNGPEGHTGYLIPIYNATEPWPGPAPEQVYVTIVAPGAVKGPHLHLKRCGMLTCIKGDVRIVVRIAGVYREYFSGESHGFATIPIPPAAPNAIYNIGAEEAYVLNMPSPPWTAADPDDHPVLTWNPEIG